MQRRWQGFIVSSEKEGNFILEVPSDKEDLHCQIQVNPKKVVYVLLGYLLQSNSRSLMYISSQQPSMPTHEEVDVLTVKRVTHSEQLAEEASRSHIARYIGRQQISQGCTNTTIISCTCKKII